MEDSKQDDVIRCACNLVDSIIAGTYNMPKEMTYAINMLQDAVYDYMNSLGKKGYGRRILTGCNYIDKIETVGYIIRTKDGKYVGIDDSTDGYVTTFFPHPFVQGEYKYVIQFDCPESAMRFCKENNIVDYVILKRGTFQYVDEDLT